ncbi:MAG: DUF4080 domain-containing protein [Candidatus Cloacimonadaceae bacterium]|nr:DUF4080 domain-containing protein [Candidatus Cloacimonadaceae bacterium]
MSLNHPKTKIVFIAVNSSWTQSSLALYYLRELIRDLPYSTKMIDFTLKDHQSDALARITKEKPDILCFSAYIWNRDFLEKLIPDLRKLLPESIFVFGGPEMPALAEKIQSGRFDRFIQGPGEAAFREQAELDFEGRGGFISRPNYPLRDIPFPYRTSDKTLLSGKLLYYESSRGCPFECVYCLSAEDKRLEARFDLRDPLDRKLLYKELDKLVSFEPKTIKFIDRSFNIHPMLAHAIWEYIIKLDCACDFHFEIYPDLLNENDLVLLEKAPPNRIRFEIGIQSTDDEINQVSHRRSNWKKSKAMLQKLLERTQIRVHADLMLGLPSQTKASVFKSIDELAPLFPHEIQLGMLKILPDTPMQAIANQRDYLWQEHPPYQVLKTDLLSFDEILSFESLARVINLYWNKGEFMPQWRNLIPKHKASKLFSALLKYHFQHDLPLHSMAKPKREIVFAEMLGQS